MFDKACFDQKIFDFIAVFAPPQEEEGRQLVVKVVTMSYRKVWAITSSYRIVKAVTAAYRTIKAITLGE